MLQKSQFNITDLQGFRRTQESLDRLLMRKDYRLGEPTLSEKMANPNMSSAIRKESMLAKACADLKIDNIIFEFKSINPALDKVAIEAFNEQKQLIDMLLALKVYRTISQQLENEAAAIFAYEEKMKAYREAIRRILKQEESESQLRNMGAQADSKREIEDALFEMRKDIHEKSMKSLEDIFEQVSRLSERYNEIQELRISNKKRNDANIKNALDSYEVNGQKIFTPEQQTEVMNLLNQKNELVNRIEALDKKVATYEANLAKDTARLNEVVTERSELEAVVADQRKQLNTQVNKELDEYISLLEDDAASEIEEHLCEEEISNIKEERNRIKKAISVREHPVSNAEHVDAEQEIPEEIKYKLQKLDKKEEYLQNKMHELKEHQAYLEQKKQERLEKIMTKDLTIPSYLMNTAKVAKLRKEEKALEQRMERTRQQITEVKAERSMLSEKLHHITQSLDHAFEKVTGYVKKIFGQDDGAKVKALQAEVQKVAETGRQEDNVLAAEAASCKQQMHQLVKQAEATVAVGASCGALIGTAAPHSQHAAAVAGFQATEQAKCAQIKATVAAALGADLGANNNLRASV